MLELLYIGGIGFMLGCGFAYILQCIRKDDECRICDKMCKRRDAIERQQDTLTK